MSEARDSESKAEHEPFLMQITAEPDNETAKRIYADWLEERGDDRAELIRVHLNLSKLPTRHQDYGSLSKQRVQFCQQCDVEWMEAVGVLDRGAMLEAVSEMMWSFRGYEQHGDDEKKARNALRRKRACQGYPRRELDKAFDRGMAVWDEMENFVSRRSQRYVYMSGHEFEEFQSQLESRLNDAFPGQDRLISSAMSWVHMNRVR